MKKIIILLSQILIVGFIYGQSVAINNSGALANQSAILDLQTNSKGILMPRMSYIERLAIVNPATGLLVYKITRLENLQQVSIILTVQYGVVLLQVLHLIMQVNLP
jgi:hypothetical protein